MMQKLSLAFSAVLACICFAMIGLMWNMFAVQADMQKESLAQLKLMTASLSAKEEKSQQRSSATDWQEFRLTLSGDEGPNTEDYEVTFSNSNLMLAGSGGSADSRVKEIMIYEQVKMKKEEQHDFGTVPPGNYFVTVRTPWGESRTEELLLGPGRSNELAVTVPAAPKTSTISFKLKIPEELNLNNNDIFFAEFQLHNLERKIHSGSWSRSGSSSKVLAAFDHNGRLLEIKANDVLTSRIVTEDVNVLTLFNCELHIEFLMLLDDVSAEKTNESHYEISRCFPPGKVKFTFEDSLEVNTPPISPDKYHNYLILEGRKIACEIALIDDFSKRYEEDKILKKKSPEHDGMSQDFFKEWGSILNNKAKTKTTSADRN